MQHFNSWCLGKGNDIGIITVLLSLSFRTVVVITHITQVNFCRTRTGTGSQAVVCSNKTQYEWYMYCILHTADQNMTVVNLSSLHADCCSGYTPYEVSANSL
jgi:hypothetical protein